MTPARGVSRRPCLGALVLTPWALRAAEWGTRCRGYAPPPAGRVSGRLGAARRWPEHDNWAALIDAELRRQRVPGAAVAVVRHDQPTWLHGAGFAHPDHQVPVRPHTVLQSGSLGKQFTAVAVLLLVQDGKLRLDDPLSRWWPVPARLGFTEPEPDRRRLGLPERRGPGGLVAVLMNLTEGDPKRLGEMLAGSTAERQTVV